MKYAINSPGGWNLTKATLDALNHLIACEDNLRFIPGACMPAILLIPGQPGRAARREHQGDLLNEYRRHLDTACWEELRALIGLERSSAAGPVEDSTPDPAEFTFEAARAYIAANAIRQSGQRHG